MYASLYRQTNSDPSEMIIGNELHAMIATADLIGCGHSEIGARFALCQSNSRIRVPISPPLAKLLSSCLSIVNEIVRCNLGFPLGDIGLPSIPFLVVPFSGALRFARSRSTDDIDPVASAR
jgi:hypothetical protein